MALKKLTDNLRIIPSICNLFITQSYLLFHDYIIHNLEVNIMNSLRKSYSGGQHQYLKVHDGCIPQREDNNLILGISKLSL